MRITVVTGPFLAIPPAPCGAVERVWSDLAAAMVAAGHQVTIVHRAHDALPATPSTRADGVALIPVRGATSRPRLVQNIVLDFVYTARVRRALPAADILVTNTFWLPIVAPRLCRKAGLVHVHVQRVPKGQVRVYLASGVARFAAVSTAIAQFIRNECGAAAPITRVFANPIATDVFRPSTVPRAAAAGRLFIYTGRIHPEKGLDLLMQAFRLFRDRHRSDAVTLRLIGPSEVADGGGGPEYVARLKALAGDTPVEFHPPIYDRAALADALRAADFYVYPSIAERGEASPVAPLEAMGTGLIPIVSALPQFGDYLSDGETGVVFDHRAADPAVALADAMDRLYGTPPEALAAWRERCARRAATFSVPDVAALYLADFEELLSGRR